jgi:hypothetical protein
MGMANENSVLLKLAADMEYFARELLDAEPFMKRVHFADHLQTSWFQMKDAIELFLKTGEVELAKEKNVTKKVLTLKRIPRTPAKQQAHEDHPKIESKEHEVRFRDVTMADGAAILLAEHKQLHGKAIENLLKRGGYRSKSKFFQNVLDATFKRDGRFRNVGGNTWELKEPSLFVNGEVEVQRDEDEASITH